MRELDGARRELERAFGPVGQWSTGSPFSRIAFLPGRGSRAYPLLNVAEDKENVYIEALAPGVKQETLEITVVGGQLTISGEKNTRPEGIKPEAFHRNERSIGKFIRTVTIPTDIAADKVSANYKDGLLLVTLPKTEQAKPKQIEVKVE